MSLIRFLFNFIIFGALFYLIWHFFPDAFATLVTWVKTIVEFAQQLGTDLYHKISSSTPKTGVMPAKTLFGVVFALLK